MKNAIRTKAAGFASALILTAIVAQPAASAEQSTYVSVKAGTSSVEDLTGSGPQIDFDSGYAFFGAFGIDTGEISTFGKMRLEAEIGHRENDADNVKFRFSQRFTDGDLEQLTVMANAYHDFLPGSQVRPYLGVGIGIADLDSSTSVNDRALTKDVTAVAFQGMAGLSFQVNQQWALDTEYRYTGVDTEERIDNHSVLVGMRFGF